LTSHDINIIVAAINELRELRWEMKDKGLDTRQVSRDILRLASRLNDFDK
jgi:hypothetical protein